MKYLFRHEKFTDSSKILELFDTDWTKLRHFKRRTLQKILLDLGYDGIFNYEFGSTYAPTVGLFDITKAEIIETVPSKDFNEKFKKQIENGNKRAKRLLETRPWMSKNNIKLAKVNRQILRENLNDYFEFEDILNDISIEDYEKYIEF